MGQLRARGFFRDPVQDQVEHQFLPWVTTATTAKLAQTHTARATTDAIVTEAGAMGRRLDLQLAERRKSHLRQEHERQRAQREQEQAAATGTATDAAAAPAATSPTEQDASSTEAAAAGAQVA